MLIMALALALINCFHNNTKSKCVCVTAGTVLVDYHYVGMALSSSFGADQCCVSKLQR